MDGTSVNAKVTRMTLQELSVKTMGKATPMAELKLVTSFVCNGKMIFLLFCIIHFIKNIRNALLHKGNDFHYPKLVVSSAFELEAGICSVKWTLDLCHRNKNKIARNIRISKNCGMH